MRAFIVHPGASYSTSDVHDGYLPALRDLGVEVWKYNLDARINVSARFLNYAYRDAHKHNPELDLPKKPLPTDVLAHAAQDVVCRALWNDLDWVIVVSGMYLHPDMLILMRKAGLKVAVLLTESPYDDEKQGAFIQYANLAWTNERSSVDYLKQWNPNVKYLGPAFDPARHHPDGPEDDIPYHDVLFIGTGFKERIEMLEAVDWDGIGADLALYGTWELLGSRHRLRKYIRGGYIDNNVANRMYRNAAINLNLYRTSKGFGRNAERIGSAESLNPRALELAASGAFTLSDRRAEVTETFGDFVPTFTTPNELEELVSRYLTDPIGRKRMSAALPVCVKDNSFQERAKALLSDLQAYDAIGPRSLSKGP